MQLSLLFSFDPGVDQVPELLGHPAPQVAQDAGAFVPERMKAIRSAARSGSV
jgi:hypothetical protein